MCLEDGPDDEECDAHAQRRDEQRWFTAETVCQKGHEEDGGDHFDDAVDSRG